MAIITLGYTLKNRVGRVCRNTDFS